MATLLRRFSLCLLFEWWDRGKELKGYGMLDSSSRISDHLSYVSARTSSPRYICSGGYDLRCDAATIRHAVGFGDRVAKKVLIWFSGSVE